MWNDVNFNYDVHFDGHKEAIRAMAWTHDGRWLVSADHLGICQYYQDNMKLWLRYRLHEQPVRGLS